MKLRDRMVGRRWRDNGAMLGDLVERERVMPMRDGALLLMCLVPGALLFGHGSQTLLEWFGGYGPEGTGGWLESMSLKPGRVWAMTAGFGEFGGGLLSALGLFQADLDRWPSPPARLTPASLFG